MQLASGCHVFTALPAHVPLTECCGVSDVLLQCNLRYHVRNKHGCEVSGRKRGAGGEGSRGRGTVGGNTVGGRRAGRPTCFRSFKCGDCGSGFVREDSYRSHMRQHEKHRIAQAISGKMEPDVFSVVVQVSSRGGGDGQ
ncbi:hypothetical protein E2C01_044827 [Portunus trituberculatus]|uniref:C2H2-type domain-containing protein n=1 Tax=Portunus trituberculatus TaxID=210409 RepID=A0A5B7FU35_PORTR|nr:hypothetical protein [Portunus trituberculatus]